MPGNRQENKPENVLITRINKLQRQIEQMRTVQNIFVFPQLAADPSSPVEGQAWENTTSHHIKVYLNGSVTTIV